MLSANYCRQLNMVSLHKKYAIDLDMSANMSNFAMTSKIVRCLQTVKLN